MRRVFNLIQRVILSLALIVAALPVKASEPPCVVPQPLKVAQSVAVCDMPCCTAKPMTEPMTCGHGASSRPGEHSRDVPRKGTKTLRKGAEEFRSLGPAEGPCQCELKSAPNPSPEAPKAVFSGFDFHSFVAILPAIPLEVRGLIELSEPGIFGIDSGPPPDLEYRSDFGRAPPVARA